MPSDSRVLARAAMVAAALSVALSAQTVIKLPKNKYTPEQDVELGRQAADEVRKQYPIIRDEKIDSYLTTLGNRLVAAAPAELQQPVYQVLVHAGKPQGDQRLRPAGRPDVRAPRDVRRRRV